MRVPAEDSNLFRFLWWPSGDFSQPMEEYRMEQLHQRAVQILHHESVQRIRDSFGQQLVDIIMHSFYVDDCLVLVAFSGVLSSSPLS